MPDVDEDKKAKIGCGRIRSDRVAQQRKTSGFDSRRTALHSARAGDSIVYYYRCRYRVFMCGTVIGRTRIAGEEQILRSIHGIRNTTFSSRRWGSFGYRDRRTLQEI